MIITIQPLKKGYAIIATETYDYPDMNQFEITARADLFANLAFLHTGIRPTIKILPIIHTPMKSKTASTNPGNKMSTASTDKSWRPAKKKAVVAKKKVVKKARAKK